MKTELGKEEQPNNKVVLDPGSKLVIFEKMGKKGLEADQSYAQSVTYGKGFPFGNWYIKMLNDTIRNMEFSEYMEYWPTRSFLAQLRRNPSSLRYERSHVYQISHSRLSSHLVDER